MAIVYIIHIHRPDWLHAGHFLGYSPNNADNPITIHKQTSSPLYQYTFAHGCTFELGLLEHFDSPEEAFSNLDRLKHSYHLAPYCSVCRDTIPSVVNQSDTL